MHNSLKSSPSAAYGTLWNLTFHCLRDGKDATREGALGADTQEELRIQSSVWIRQQAQMHWEGLGPKVPREWAWIPALSVFPPLGGPGGTPNPKVIVEQ